MAASGVRVEVDRLHPVRVQLRDRGAARRRRRAPARARARRRRAPDLAGLRLREALAPRLLPERPAPPDEAAAAPRRRQLRGDRLGHRDPRGGGALRRRCATRTAASRSSITAAADRAITCRAPTGAPRAPCSARATARARSRRRRRASSGSRDRMLGGYTRGDFEHCEVALFLGKNPWFSHSIPRARVTLREIANDPTRTLIVVDPRRSETAEIADIHLQVKPGERRLPARGADRRDRAGGPARARLARRARRRARRGAAALRAPAGRRLLREVRRARRRWCARPRGASPARVERRDLRGSRRADEPALDAGLVPAQAARAADRELRQAGRRLPPDARSCRWRAGATAAAQRGARP